MKNQNEIEKEIEIDNLTDLYYGFFKTNTFTGRRNITKSIFEKGAQSKEKDVLRIIKEEIECPTYEGSIKELQEIKNRIEQNEN